MTFNESDTNSLSAPEQREEFPKAKLVGYVNVLKRNSGFCFPVYEDENGRFMYDGRERKKPGEGMDKPPFYFKMEEQEITADPRAIFVYGEGKKYLIGGSLEDLKQLLDGQELSKGERMELNDFFNRGELTSLRKDVETSFSEDSKNSISDFPTAEDVTKCEKYPVSISLADDVDIHALVTNNKEKVDEILEDVTKSDYAFVLFTLLRFETLPGMSTEKLNLEKWRNFDFKDERVHVAIFLLALKNNDENTLSKYFKEGVGQSSTDENSILKRVQDYLSFLERQEDLDVSTYRAKLNHFLEKWEE